MIDHVTVSIRNLKKSRAFYVKALKPLGFGVMMEFKNFSAFGENQKPTFWLKQAKPVTVPQHIAFYKAALKAGGKDAGAPGVRARYHPGYYGAFVLDPDGHPIEAVCHVER